MEPERPAFPARNPGHVGPSPPAAPSAPRCLTHLRDFSTRLGADGGTKPWVGGTLAGPPGSRWGPVLPPQRPCVQGFRGTAAGEGQEGSLGWPWGAGEVQRGGLGGAGAGDRAGLVPVGRAFLVVLCSWEDRRCFYSALLVAPCAEREAEGRSMLLRAAGCGGGAWRPRRGRGEGAAWTTHLRAGEWRGPVGLSPATTPADSDPRIRPPSPSPACRLSPGRRVRSGVSRRC